MVSFCPHLTFLKLPLHWFYWLWHKHIGFYPTVCKTWHIAQLPRCLSSFVRFHGFSPVYLITITNVSFEVSLVSQQFQWRLCFPPETRKTCCGAMAVYLRSQNSRRACGWTWQSQAALRSFPTRPTWNIISKCQSQKLVCRSEWVSCVRRFLNE